MAKNNELQSLVQQFVSQVEAVIAKELSSNIAEKFDAFRASVLSGRGAVAAAPRAAAPVAAKAAKKKSPLAGREAELKPCPICGTPNKARRFSYLCDNHRTPENREKFKGTAKAAPVPAAAPAAPAVKRGPGRPPKAAKAAKVAKAAKPAGKRGPGRPKGSKNKKPAAAAKTESASSSA